MVSKRRHDPLEAQGVNSTSNVTWLWVMVETTASSCPSHLMGHGQVVEVAVLLGPPVVMPESAMAAAEAPSQMC